MRTLIIGVLVAVLLAATVSACTRTIDRGGDYRGGLESD